MKTLEIDDEELSLLLAAVRSYLDDFGHEEADLLRRVKRCWRSCRRRRRLTGEQARLTSVRRRSGRRRPGRPTVRHQHVVGACPGEARDVGGPVRGTATCPR